jgi:hypothetical protein
LSFEQTSSNGTGSFWYGPIVYAQVPMEIRLAIAPSSLYRLRLLVIADVRVLLASHTSGPKYRQRDERLGAGVLDRHALDRRPRGR